MNRNALSLLLLALALPAAAEEERPLGGWRMTASDTADYMQDVHYPAVRVNSGGKSAAGLISGEIRATPKGGVPTLVVNGSPLPLPLEGTSYARPYAFGAGSNSVEVRDGEGRVQRRTQFYEANAGQVAPALRVVLAWDTDHTDVDLHVVTPSGQHAWYGQRVIESGGALDVDVTDGYGPEIFSSPAPEVGPYLVYANYYGGDSGEALTVAQVTVIQHEGTLREKRTLLQVPLRRPGELNFVTSFIFQK